jgi:hypothetical protein
MNVVLLLLALLIPPLLLIRFWCQRRKHPDKIEASNVAIEVRPTKVILPDEDSDSEERTKRRRTGETQELRRKVVHGPYRAIDDRGAPSKVEIRRQS